MTPNATTAINYNERLNTLQSKYVQTAQRLKKNTMERIHDGYWTWQTLRGSTTVEPRRVCHAIQSGTLIRRPIVSAANRAHVGDTGHTVCAICSRLCIRETAAKNEVKKGAENLTAVQTDAVRCHSATRDEGHPADDLLLQLAAHRRSLNLVSKCCLASCRINSPETIPSFVRNKRRRESKTETAPSEKSCSGWSMTSPVFGHGWNRGVSMTTVVILFTAYSRSWEINSVFNVNTCSAMHMYITRWNIPPTPDYTYSALVCQEFDY